MKAKIKFSSEYGDIKEALYHEYGSDLTGLPEKLDGNFFYLRSVRETALNWIRYIDEEIKTIEGKATVKKISDKAKLYKKNLVMLYQDLEDKDRWNRPMQRLEDII